MKLSLNWLKQYVKLPAELTAQQIQYDLTMSTVEVEHVEDLAASLNKVCVGQIKELSKHPDADKLRIALTDLGPTGVHEIVCGGSNLEVGQFVAVSLPGAFVRWHGQGDLVAVKETKIRGKASYGMICASEEIGLSSLFPAKAEAEIIALNPSELKLAPGQPLAEVLGFQDFILDIDNKSLSNRPDLWGHIGIARELAAIYDCPLQFPELTEISFTDSEQLKVSIQEPSFCSRYIGLLIDNVANQPSPFWLQSQLARVGQRPISLLVDLTNYVMLALGQPTHVFDQRQVKNLNIEVRHAHKGETLQLLDETELKLRPDSLIIADSEKPLALAGVMGGLPSGVAQDTNKIIFEAANFDAVKVRRAAAEYGVRTESSMRFEKSLDPENPYLAAGLFLKTLSTIQPKVKLQAAVDQYTRPPAKKIIEISRAFIESRLGQSADSEFIIRKLQPLGFQVKENSTGYSVGVPSYRATGDVGIKEDIIEEIARMLGYDNLDAKSLKVDLNKALRQTAFINDRRIREFLAQRGGLVELVNYPWINKHLAEVCGSSLEQLVKLAESPGTDCETLRDSLIPGLLESIAKNTAHFEHFGCFEVGSVFRNDRQPFSKTSAHEALPVSNKNLALALVGQDQQQVFLELKGIIEDLFRFLAVDLDFKTAAPLKIRNQGALEIHTDGRLLGSIFLPTGTITTAAGIKRGCVAMAELNFSELRSLPPSMRKYVPLPKFPAVDFDLAVVFDKSVKWQDIHHAVLASDKLIDSIRFMDLYEGEQVPAGKKSIAFSMRIVPTEKTLTAEEIAQISNRVIKNLGKQLGGELRK